MKGVHSPCSLPKQALSKEWPPSPGPCLQDSKNGPTWRETLQPTLVAMIILLLLKLVQQAYLDSLPVFTSEVLDFLVAAFDAREWCTGASRAGRLALFPKRGACDRHSLLESTVFLQSEASSAF